MNGKNWLAVAVLLCLLATPAFAAITITWNTPSANQTYNNKFNNAQRIDLNWSWTDNNNDAGNTLDFNLLLRARNNWTFKTIASDKNVYDANVNPTSTLTCFVKTPTGVSGSCSYNWQMLLDTDMPDNVYCFDVNMTENRALETGGTTYSMDKNATRCIIVNSGFAAAQQTRDLLLPAGVIVAAGVAIAAVLAILAGASIMTTVVTAGIALIVITVILYVFGFITAMI